MGFRDGLKDLLSKTSRQLPPEQPPADLEHAGGVTPADGEHSSADHDLILALTMSLQERDIARKLADVESCNLASAKRKSIIDSVMCDGLQHALSYKLWQDNCLEYTDVVPDGFYDAWGDFGDIVPSATDFPSLHDLRGIPRVAGDTREVLLVDHSADPGLCTAVEHLTELLNEDSSVRDKIQAIAEVVCSALGGSAPTKELYQRWLQASQATKKQHRGIVIPLGELSVGLHRHRALLFKVLADSIKLPCRMVRSGHKVPPGGALKAAALVRLGGTEVIVDLMRSPGRTVPFALGGDLTKLLVLNGGQAPPPLQVPLAMPDLMTFDSPLPKGLPDLPEHGSSSPIHAEHSSPPPFERAAPEGKDASRPQTPAASSRPQTGRMASPSSPTQSKRQGDPWSASGSVVHSASSPQLAQLPHTTPPPSASSNPFGSPQPWPPMTATPSSGATTATPPNGVQERRLSGNPFAEGASVPRLQLSSRAASTPPSNWSHQATPPNSAPPFGSPAPLPGYGGGWPQQRGRRSESPAPSVAMAPSAKFDWLRLEGHESSSESLRKLSDDTDVFRALDPLRPVPVEVGGGPGMGSTNSSRPSSEGMAAQRAQTPPDPMPPFKQQSSVVDDLDQPGSLAPMGAQPTGDSTTMGRPGPTAAAQTGAGQRLSQQLTVELLADDWEIDFADIKLGSRIGIGSYGEVYKGVWRHTEVAVKKLLEQEVSEQTMKELKREVAIMKRMRHPNIITFLGAVTKPPNMAIVTQYAARGSLFRMLHRCPNAEPLDERRRLRMARDIACGMLYLASCKPPIVHRDLKSPNILIDKDYTAKVCDFGLSRACQAAFMTNRTQAGTPEWTAPEVLRGEAYDLKSDVFSYGVVLWELATLREPWKDSAAVQVIGVVGYGKVVLPIPDFVAPGVASIIRDCFAPAAERPGFGEILERLDGAERLTTLQPGANKKTAEA